MVQGILFDIKFFPYYLHSFIYDIINLHSVGGQEMIENIKNNLTSIILITLLFTLSACATEEKNQEVEEEYPVETTEDIEINEYHLEENDFFTDLYYEFVQNYREYTMESVTDFLEDTNYSYRVTDEEDILKSITVWDIEPENNHMVLSFDSPEAPKKPALSGVVLYLNSENAELSFANYSANQEKQYDEFTVHIDGNYDGIEVDSIDEQVEVINEELTEEIHQEF